MILRNITNGTCADCTIDRQFHIAQSVWQAACSRKKDFSLKSENRAENIAGAGLPTNGLLHRREGRGAQTQLGEWGMRIWESEALKQIASQLPTANLDLNARRPRAVTNTHMFDDLSWLPSRAACLSSEAPSPHLQAAGLPGPQPSDRACGRCFCKIRRPRLEKLTEPKSQGDSHFRRHGPKPRRRSGNRDLQSSESLRGCFSKIPVGNCLGLAVNCLEFSRLALAEV